MNVRDAVLGALATAGVGALATGAFQPVSEVVYGVSDKLVNAYVPKSLRKPLPNSAKSIQPMKFDINNTPKARAQFDRDKDKESWNLIKEDLDKLSFDEVLNYDKDLIDKKYQSKLEDYKNQRRHDIFNGDHSMDEALLAVPDKILNGGVAGSVIGTGLGALGGRFLGKKLIHYNKEDTKGDIALKHLGNLGLALGGIAIGSKLGSNLGAVTGFGSGLNNIISEASKDLSKEKKHKLRTSIIIGSSGVALTGLGLAKLIKDCKPISVTEVIPPFENKNISEAPDKLVNEMGIDQSIDLAQQSNVGNNRASLDTKSNSKKDLSNEYIVRDIESKEDLDNLYNNSAFTMEGCDINDIKEFHNLIRPYLNDKVPLNYGVIKGSTMNDVYKLTGSNRYPDNLNIVVMNQDAFKESPKRLIPRGRWFDDVVNNNADRESKDHSQSNLALKEDPYHSKEFWLVNPKAEKKHKLRKGILIGAGLPVLAGVSYLAGLASAPKIKVDFSKDSKQLDKLIQDALDNNDIDLYRKLKQEKRLTEQAKTWKRHERNRIAIPVLTTLATVGSVAAMTPAGQNVIKKATESLGEKFRNIRRKGSYYVTKIVPPFENRNMSRQNKDFGLSTGQKVGLGLAGAGLASTIINAKLANRYDNKAKSIYDYEPEEDRLIKNKESIRNKLIDDMKSNNYKIEIDNIFNPDDYENIKTPEEVLEDNKLFYDYPDESPTDIRDYKKFYNNNKSLINSYNKIDVDEPYRKASENPEFRRADKKSTNHALLGLVSGLGTGAALAGTAYSILKNDPIRQVKNLDKNLNRGLFSENPNSSNESTDHLKPEKKRKLKEALKITGVVALGAGALGGLSYLNNKAGYNKGYNSGFNAGKYTGLSEGFKSGSDYGYSKGVKDIRWKHDIEDLLGSMNNNIYGARRSIDSLLTK